MSSSNNKPSPGKRTFLPRLPGSVSKLFRYSLIVIPVLLIGSYYLLMHSDQTLQYARGKSDSVIHSQIQSQTAPLVPVTEAIPQQDISGSPQTLINEETVPETEKLVTPDFESAIKNIEYLLKSNEDAHSYFNNRLEMLENDVKQILDRTKLPQINNEELYLRLDRMQQYLEQHLERQKAQERKAVDHSRMPPFTLISVENWNTEWNAVISLDSRITMIALNESRLDWQLKNIDPLGNTATFENQKSKIEHIMRVSE